MVSLGTSIPGFNLPDVISGQMVSSDGFDPARPVLVLFIAPHCPFTRNLTSAIRGLIRDYRDRVSIVALCANDVAQVPEDSREGLKRLAAAVELTGPFLHDEGQGIARAFGATCTPECFLVRPAAEAGLPRADRREPCDRPPERAVHRCASLQGAQRGPRARGARGTLRRDPDRREPAPGHGVQHQVALDRAGARAVEHSLVHDS